MATKGSSLGGASWLSVVFFIADSTELMVACCFHSAWVGDLGVSGSAEQLVLSVVVISSNLPLIKTSLPKLIKGKGIRPSMGLQM